MQGKVNREGELTAKNFAFIDASATATSPFLLIIIHREISNDDNYKL